MKFQAERWNNVESEIAALFDAHWKEIALNRDRIPLDFDFEAYRAFDTAGLLHVLTARDDGKLVGYYVSVVRAHPHYKSTLYGMVDIYFILPEYRKAAVGLQFFRELEKSMRALGVQSLLSMTKKHHDMSRLFERLGWTPIETVFQKWIGD